MTLIFAESFHDTETRKMNVIHICALPALPKNERVSFIARVMRIVHNSGARKSRCIRMYVDAIACIVRCMDIQAECIKHCQDKLLEIGIYQCRHISFKLQWLQIQRNGVMGVTPSKSIEWSNAGSEATNPHTGHARATTVGDLIKKGRAAKIRGDFWV